MRASRSARSPITSSVLFTGSGIEAGRFTLQLMLDQGAAEEVISITAEDAEVVQQLLQANKNVHYDIPGDC